MSDRQVINMVMCYLYCGLVSHSHALVNVHKQSLSLAVIKSIENIVIGRGGEEARNKSRECSQLHIVLVHPRQLEL